MPLRPRSRSSPPRPPVSDRSCAEELYERYGREVYAHLRRLAPQELAADLTVRVFTASHGRPAGDVTDSPVGTVGTVGTVGLAVLLRDARRRLVEHYTRPDS